MSRRFERLDKQYVAWIARRWVAIIVAHVVLAAGAVYLILNHLPLYADFSYLLPQDSPSVRDLRRLEGRVKATDMVLVVIEAPNERTRGLATEDMARGAETISKDLVLRIEGDDAELRAFLKARRHLFVPLDELERAHEALAKHIEGAKIRANPLFVDLDPPDPEVEARDRKQFEELQTKRREAEAKLDRPTNVNADGRVALLQIRALFRATDATNGAKLLGELDKHRDAVMAKYPGVQIGFAGSVVTAVAEHDAISKGMLLSSVITALLVGVVLVMYFRSATLLGLLIGTLAIATTMSFGLAAITVGHLNAATAFLGAIIAGNGINYGILLIARYLEERRRHDHDDAMAAAISGTLRPTAVASLGAAIAYGSLAATSFRGFADFAIIGAIGMLVCWVATYGLLPALMSGLGRNTRIYTGDPIVGSTLVRLLGFRRSSVVCVVAMILAAVSTVIVVRYIAADPFEYDIKELRSEGPPALEAHKWIAASDKHFGRGLSNRTYIAADREEQVPRIVAALRARDEKAIAAGAPPAIGTISTIADAVPDNQVAKIAILDKIQKLIDDNAQAIDQLDEPERTDLLALRPPDLEPFTNANLPQSLRERLTEKDGRIGLLVAIRPSEHLDEWNGKDLIRFANAVKKLDIGAGETITTSGSSVIFADIVEAISRDGPLVTLVASIGLVLMVLLLVGPNRQTFAVLAGTGAGTLLMVAICAVIGLRVNFLDFVALPITLGLGIDYAINVAHRQGEETLHDPIHTLLTSGSAVFVCSLTTVIGYGSLLASDNLAIRGFGTASLIGEITCVFTALVLVPAILALGRQTKKPVEHVITDPG